MKNNEKHIEFYELATKKLSGELSQTELIQFDELLTSSDENKKIFSDLEKVWNTSESQISVDINAAWNKLSDRIDSSETPVIQISTSRTWQWMSVAASIVLVLGIFTLFKFGSPEQVEFVAQASEQLQLSDGSKIDIKKGSKLTYPDKFTTNTREINLEGEAFFDIERDETKPFIIHTSTVDVKVLGTSFFVNELDNGDVEVVVKTGKVCVTDINNDTNEVVLTANESIIFNKIDNTFKTIKVEANKLYWQTKTLIFKRTTLKEVVNIVNMNFDKQLVIANGNMLNCKLTATFKDKSFEEILEVIKATFNATIEQVDDKLIIDGESCE